MQFQDKFKTRNAKLCPCRDQVTLFISIESISDAIKDKSKQTKITETNRQDYQQAYLTG